MAGISGGSIVHELEQELGGGIVMDVWSRWKDRVKAAMEKGIGRKKVTRKSGIVAGRCGEVNCYYEDDK